MGTYRRAGDVMAIAFSPAEQSEMMMKELKLSISATTQENKTYTFKLNLTYGDKNAYLLELLYHEAKFAYAAHMGVPFSSVPFDFAKMSLDKGILTVSFTVPLKKESNAHRTQIQ